MSFYNPLEPQFEAPQAVNLAESMDWAKTSVESVPTPPLPPSPLFAPKPWDTVFFEDLPIYQPASCLAPSSWEAAPVPAPAPATVSFQTPHWSEPLPCPPSRPAESVYAVDQLPPDSFSGDFPVTFPSTEWQPLDKSHILSTAKIEALCRSIGLSNPNFSAMEPSIPDALEPALMAYPAPMPPLFAEPVPAALNRRRKAQRQLDAVLKGSEVPQENKRGRKPLALGAPKAKYTKKMPGAPKEPAKPKRAYNRRTRGPADLTSVQRSR